MIDSSINSSGVYSGGIARNRLLRARGEIRRGICRRNLRGPGARFAEGADGSAANVIGDGL